MRKTWICGICSVAPHAMLCSVINYAYIVTNINEYYTSYRSCRRSSYDTIAMQRQAQLYKCIECCDHELCTIIGPVKNDQVLQLIFQS